MARRLLETDSSGTPEGREESELSPYTILYTICPGCRTASIPTPEGPVEVPEETAAAVEGSARKVVLELDEEIVEEKEKESPRHNEKAEKEEEEEEREGSEQDLRVREDAGKAGPTVDPDEPGRTARQEENASQKEEKESSSVSARETESSGDAECSELGKRSCEHGASDHECSEKMCCGAACSSQKQRPDPRGEPAKVVRDRPNTRHVRVRVNLRDGLCCRNPCCGRRLWLFAHHIRFRSRGGRTIPGNECLLCGWCHTLIHAGFLMIEGTPLEGLRFVSRGALLREAFYAELRANKVDLPPPVFVIQSEGRAPGGRGAAQNGNGRDSELEELLRDSVSGLVALGARKREARARAEETLERFLSKEGRRPTLEEILSRALSKR